jgi:hypothetical protein
MALSNVARTGKAEKPKPDAIEKETFSILI